MLLATVLAMILVGAIVAKIVNREKSPEERFRESIFRKDLSAAEEYIAAGGDIDAGDHYGLTALMIAAGRGNNEMVAFLLNNGADPNISNRYGVTPFMLAVQRGSIDIANSLLANGADLNARNKDGATALTLVRKRKKRGMIRYLEMAGATE
jgi:ankyrin repeat protein